jgi:thiamine biosynthesis lipoprotein ApbE
MASPRLAAGLAALGLCACGASGDELTAEEYRERGNRLCREAAEDARGLEGSGLRAQIERSVEQAEAYQDRFEQLEPPSELRELHDQAERQGREALELLREAQDAVDGGDEPGRSLLELGPDLDRVLRQGAETSRELGLDDCVPGAP